MYTEAMDTAKPDLNKAIMEKTLELGLAVKIQEAQLLDLKDSLAEYCNLLQEMVNGK